MNYKENYESWLSSDKVSEEAKAEIRSLSDKELLEAFSRELEFGTGGLRGIMGQGTNRMNIYTVRRATQGVANSILKSGKDASERGVVIAHDSRNNSRKFAIEAARVLSANKIKVYLFDSLRPTPELSFAVRELGCAMGIVITASHNPKEYNGYKVYGSDGAQIGPEAAERILSYILATDIFEGVFVAEKEDSVAVGAELDKKYIESVKRESLGEKIPEELSVIYTPLHGAGCLPVKAVLSEIGVKRLTVVSEQEMPDGNFPTVNSPNPENAEAFNIAIEYARKNKADLIIGTDPDSDRIGVVVPERDGSFTILNGNQTGALLAEYILRKTAPVMPKNPRLVKTIVTTDMVRKIAEDYGVKTVDVLTGFKYIGDKIKEYEASGESFIFGLEESYGYLKGSYARDKDAVVGAMLITELCAECFKKGITLSERLDELYKKYGYFKEKLISFTFHGIEGAEKIKSIMESFRKTERLPRETLRIDYSKGIDGLPPSNVLKIIFENGYLAARPSGTEPKIKFYISKSADTDEACDKEVAALTELVNALAK